MFKDFMMNLTIIFDFFAGNVTKKENSKKMKLQSGEKYGTIYSRKLRGGGEKYKKLLRNFKRRCKFLKYQERFFLFFQH